MITCNKILAIHSIGNMISPFSPILCSAISSNAPPRHHRTLTSPLTSLVMPLVGVLQNWKACDIELYKENIQYPGLLILQYNIVIASIADNFFSITILL